MKLAVQIQDVSPTLQPEDHDRLIALHVGIRKLCERLKFGGPAITVELAKPEGAK